MNGHRDHARFTGEAPKTPIDRGPFGLKVSLDMWGPKENLMAHIWNELTANWGNEPARVEKDEDLTTPEMEHVYEAFAGKTLSQVLEGVHFWFTIDGVTRACTHQLVRTRIGAAMMQHGGRDNDWRHRPWTMPETIHRACSYFDREPAEKFKYDDRSYQMHPCVRDREALDNYIYGSDVDGDMVKLKLRDRVFEVVDECKQLYAALVDAGIPWQDARRVLPIGLQTYIHINYNYLALKGVLANRLEHVMDWEINCVSQLMLREIKMKCPSIFSKNLGSHSDRMKKAAFENMESWPPDGKYASDKMGDVRTHNRTQMPFWVLSPESMEGGPIEWIPTNGIYPKNLRPKGENNVK